MTFTRNRDLLKRTISRGMVLQAVRLLLLLCLVSRLPVHAQTPVQLEKTLQETSDKAKRLPLLNQLADLSLSGQPQQTVKYATEALSIAQELNSKTISDTTTVEAEYKPLLLLKTACNNMGNFEKAITFEIKLMYYYKAIGDTDRLCASLRSIADSYNTLGVYASALEFYIKLLKIEEKRNNAAKVADTFNAIGLLFRQQQNYNKSLEYFFDALRYNQKLVQEAATAAQRNVVSYREHLLQAANIYNNIGGTHYFVPQNDSALFYFKKAHDLRVQAGDTVGVSKSLNNLGLIYRRKGDHKNALLNFTKCLKILRSWNDTASLSTVLDNIGDVYLLMGDAEKALKYQHEALEIAKKYKLKNRILETYESLVETYLEIGNYQKAYEYEHLFRLVKDSTYTEKSTRLIAEMQTRFETDKHEKEIEILTQQREIQDLEKTQMAYLFSIIGAIALIIILIVYWQFHVKKKSNAVLVQQNAEINQHKEEIEAQRDFLEQALSEIDKKNNDIMGSLNYARRIQHAILPQLEDIRKELPEFFVLFRPKSRVSGDFYWFARKEEKILIAAVDCTGHGVPGAFMSLIGTSLLNEIVHTFDIMEPERILVELDKGVRRMLRQQSTQSRDGMDLALCVFDRLTGVVEFAGAKNPVLYIQNGEVQIIKGDRHPIGGEDFSDHAKVFTRQTIDLGACDGTTTFYLFSDGFQDQFGGAENKKFMLKRLKELLYSIHEQPFHEQQEILEKTLVEWMGNEEPQTDDILVIGFRLTHQATVNGKQVAIGGQQSAVISQQ